MPRKKYQENFVIGDERRCVRCKKYRPNTLDYYTNRKDSTIDDPCAQKVCIECVESKERGMQSKGKSYNKEHDDIRYRSAAFVGAEFSDVLQRYLTIPFKCNQKPRPGVYYR